MSARTTNGTAAGRSFEHMKPEQNPFEPFLRFRVFLQWLGRFELNPIVMKELRQAVRSWAVVGVMLLFLVVLFFTVLGMTINANVSYDSSRAVGREVMQVILTILTFTSLVFIPTYVGVRIANERQPNNTDLLYVTTLSPARIIRGKLLSGSYVAFLFFSVCSPFMFFSTLLRGVDLPTICVVIITVFVLVVVGIQLAIFLACLPVTRGFKALLAIGALFFAFGGVSGVTFHMTRTFRSGLGSTLMTSDFWLGVLFTGSILVMVLGLFHLLSISMISAPTSNRAKPVRVYVTIITAFSALLMGGYYWALNAGNMVVGWTGIMTALWVMAFFCSVCERDRHSLRIRRTIPQTFVLRRISFLFYSGAAGGVLWSGLGVAATIFAGHQMLEWIPELSGFASVSRLPSEFWPTSITLVLYAIAYCFYGLSIQRWFFPHKSTMLAGLFAVLLPVIWCIVPTIILAFLNDFSWEFLKRQQLGNPLNLFNGGDAFLYNHLTCSWIMAVIGAVINLPWFIRSWRDFKPLDPAPPDPKES